MTPAPPPPREPTDPTAATEAAEAVEPDKSRNVAQDWTATPAAGDVGARGAQVRQEVLGPMAERPPSAFAEPFREWVLDAAWGRVWDRPGLDRRTRSCITLAVLAALRCEDELAMHVEAALRNGVTREEIAEVLLHATVYAGAPAGNAAFATATRVLADLDAAEDDG
jgi:4-carboxymuconolactone decarboxylase